ncbi:hypothetical protein AB1Y20_022580 [Prymnesium parvum]|uniref:Uncharacterized protein n=1 Tax=Prymnesium parvum TaxID=97485 RepID=A0AB34JGB1_PRYPA
MEAAVQVVRAREEEGWGVGRLAVEKREGAKRAAGAEEMGGSAVAQEAAEGWVEAVLELAMEAEVTGEAGVEGVGLVLEAMATAEEKVAPQGRVREADEGRGAEVQVEAKKGQARRAKGWEMEAVKGRGAEVQVQALRE